MTDTPISAPAARHWVGPLMMLCGGIAIGFAPIDLRLGLDDLGPQAIAFWRYVFAAPVLFLLVLGIQKRLPSKPNMFIVIGGTCFALDIGLWHWGLTLTSVSNATFIVNLGNVGVGFAAWFFLKERPTPVWFIAVILAMAGAAALSLGAAGGGSGNIRGDLLSLAAAVLVSGYLLASKLARRTMSGIDAVFWLTCVEIIVAGMMVMTFREDFLPAHISGFLAPFILGVGIHVIGQGLIITGLGITPTSVAGVLILIQPVVAAAVSWQLFNEPLTSIQAAGSALILFAVWLAQSGHKPQPVD